MVQLEVERVLRRRQRAAKRFNPARHQKVAGVHPLRQSRDRQFGVFLQEQFQGAVDPGASPLVCIVHENHARAIPAEHLHVAGGERGAHRRDHVRHTHLVGHQDVGVPLHYRQAAGRLSGELGPVDSVNQVRLRE